jgi:hypothetical protein
MTERNEPYTPSRWYAEIHFYEDGSFRQTNGSSFVKWLAAHDEAVRQEERERCARIAERLHGVGNDIVAARIGEQGKEQGA